ncbi:co-chaperone DjlA [Candidatus Methylocalor cossyra]|uniref:Co-chaperone protein DjlA n=1 Tax=Candidatus Methylocalor cossyra TaxID=3108543 RepID=A0ABM9NKZ6_9GAMM
MTWLGKVVGGTFGFLMGGPLGALLGAAFGHQLDRNLDEVELLESDGAAGVQYRVQMAFFTATFSVMGHIAKADGRVSEAEIDAARRVMGRMELPEDLRRTAIHLYHQGKRADFPLDAALEQFRQECQKRYALFRVFIEIQLEAALADGVLHRSAEQLLLRICDRLNFSRFEFYAMRARLEAERRFARHSHRARQRARREPPTAREPSLADAYAVLGASASASDSDIKRAYRRLMSQHHPDKLAARGVPEEMLRLATEKTQQIRRAYDAIAKARKL